MTTVHFIRHGEVDNPDNVYYGRLPGFPINENGKQCIEYTAKQLKRYPVAAVYHSPMLRNQQSAEIIAQTLNVPSTEDERLIEIATFFEGQPRGEHERVPHYPPAKAGYAETMAEIYERLADFIQEKVELHPDAHIVAVTHGGPIRIAELGLQGMPFTDAIYEEKEVPTCGSDTVVTVDGDKITVSRADL